MRHAAHAAHCSCGRSEAHAAHCLLMLLMLNSLTYAAAAAAWLTSSSSSMHSCLSAERRSITHSAVSCVPLSTSQRCHVLAAACNRNTHHLGQVSEKLCA